MPETPYLFRHDENPGIPDTVCRGKNGSLLPLPFPIFNLVHVHCPVQYIHLLYGTDDHLYSFYPVSGITDERTAVTLTAHYPVTFLALVYNFLCMCNGASCFALRLAWLS